MNNQSEAAFGSGRKQELNIWYCEGCHSFHFRTGEVLLTFSPQEFIELSSVVSEFYGKASLEVIKQQTVRSCQELELVA